MDGSDEDASTSSEDKLKEEINEEDFEQQHFLEPQVIIKHEGICPLCEGPLKSHYQGQPCGSYEISSSGHFLFDEEASASSSDKTHPSLSKCIICSSRNPSRTHLANHFMSELIEQIEDIDEDCQKCGFGAANPKAMVLHEVTKHEGLILDKILQDAAIVSSKRVEIEAKGHRQVLGPLCPICDQPMHKSHGRDHVSWHFVEELREMIQDPTKCPENGCSYVGDKLEAVTRHLALFHCKLDEFLQNEQLVAAKRAKVLSKPKKVFIGPRCPICNIKDPAREHVSRHFMNELMEYISSLDDPLQCPDCSYKGEKPPNLARHVALVHSKLDEMLGNPDLVAKRKKEHMSKPSKINIGSECPVCDQPLTKQHSRVHVIWHFMDELREIVHTFKDPTRCDMCTYMNPNSDKVVKHIALGHSKLDEMLQNDELVQRKRELASTRPKRESIGPECPICNVKDPPREHVARHFGDELSEFVNTLKDPLKCYECNYQGEKPKNLGLHIALVHGQLDVFLKDRALVQAKIMQFNSMPKKQNIGPRCPICDLVFTKSQNRDHVAWHFIDELREFVQSFDDPTKCWRCDYQSEKMDNLVKHVALGHSKLDELLQNEDLVMEKRAKALAKPRRVAIGPTCPVCNARDPAREHVARHFSDELLALVHDYPDPCACIECEYKADKPKTLSIHVGLVHNKLDFLLQDKNLVYQKRTSYFAKPKKLSIGPTCPVCDQRFTKAQNRDHVSWHFIEELRAIVQEFDDPNQCPQCPYSADTNEKMVKHVALGHSMLDALLQDESLLEQKRMKAMSKPKKVNVGSTCPICDSKEPSREHVSRHFSDELLDIVMGFQDPSQCTQCSYKNDKPKNVSIHIALVHSILDHFLSDQELVKSKRETHSAKPQKVNIGNQCPVCDAEFTKGQNRDHVCWHFMDELRDLVLSFPDTKMCNECSYTSDKLDNLVKHVALGHSKLDELLTNEDLVAQKREQAFNKPKKIHIGPNCPVCDMKFTKSQNRDHVSWHFIDELRDYVHSTGRERECQLCSYTTEKMDNLVKHYALGHSKLDEYLLDEDLIKRKREEHAKKPKRLSFGPDCPICHEKNRDRDHLSRHFMAELMELVNEMPNKKQCSQCPYKSSKREYMAKHLALYHCKLDELMADENLVKMLQNKANAKPKRVPMGENCIVCGVSFPQREHVCRHFMDELLNITNSFTSPLSCAFCPFTADRAEYVARHVGLVHRKLDEMLGDSELVAKKMAEFSGSPNAMSVTKIEPVRKSQRQLKPVIKDGSVFSIEKPRKRKICETKDRDNVETATAVAAKVPKIKTEPEPEVDEENNAMLPYDYDSASDHDEEISDVKEEVNENDDKIAESPVQVPKLKNVKIEPPKVTIEKVVKQEKKSSNQQSFKTETAVSSVSLLKSTLLKPKPAALKLSSTSLLKPQISLTPTTKNSSNPTSSGTTKNSSNQNFATTSLLKKAPATAKITTATTKTTVVPALPPSISLTPAKPKKSSESLLKSQQTLISSASLPSKPAVLDTASIADINNSWAESLMSNSSSGSSKINNKKFIQDWLNNIEQPCSEIENNTPPPPPVLKTIGSCTLTPATGNKKSSKNTKPVTSSVPITISLQKISSKSTNLTPSVTLTPADPYSKSKRIKFNITPTATITPLRKKGDGPNNHPPSMTTTTLLKPLFPKKPLENSCNITSKPKITTIITNSMLPKKPVKIESEQMIVCTPELPNHYEEDESLEMILEPQIILNDDEDFGDYPDDGNGNEYTRNDDQLSDEEEMEIDDNEEEHIRKMEENLIKDQKEDDDEVLEFCDLCDMELEHHPDNQPCPPDETYVKEFKTCPICDKIQPTREHVAKHFMEELKEVVEKNNDDPLTCSQCDYQSEKTSETVALHFALNHDAIKPYIMDQNLIQLKRSALLAKTKNITTNDKKINTNNMDETCTICGFKDPTREHIARHFMNELLDYVAMLPDPLKCNQCSYHGDKPQNLARHLALVHNMLDELLQDQALIEQKINEALSKPKKISIGSTCPVCLQAIQKRDSRVHVIWHFMEELREMVHQFRDPKICDFCPYTNGNPDKMAKHMALGHSKLDELLSNRELLAVKKEKAKTKPKKLNMGPECPICGLQFTKSQNRDHVSWHFMDELREYVQTFSDPQQCNQCEYRSDKIDNLVKHLALGHSKLDELLLNEELVAQKKIVAKAKPKKVSLGPNCPICDITFTKSQNRDHVSWHFMEELRTIVNNEFEDPQVCNQCDYQTDKMDNLVKHLALGHSKLDEFLMDEELVASKRMQYFNSGKK